MSLCVGSLTFVFSSLLSVKITSLFSLFIFSFILFIFFSLAIGLYRFYRDPKRLAPNEKNIIISPADGKIRYIKKINEYINEFEREFDGLRIGIIMTYLDVHINRSPISGKIIYVKDIKGKFISLKKEEGIHNNRRTAILIDNGNFVIGLILIASRVVRKIIVWKKLNDEVKTGEKIGKIVFGSQTDIFIPIINNLKINVKVGQQVYAGITILARYG